MRKIAFHLNCLEQNGLLLILQIKFAAKAYQVLIETERYGEDEFQIDERVKRVHVGLREGDEKKNHLLQILLRIKYLKDLIKKEKPDILIPFARKAFYRRLMVAYFMKIPILISIRTDLADHYEEIADKIQIPILFPRVDGCDFDYRESCRRLYSSDGSERQSGKRLSGYGVFCVYF